METQHLNEKKSINITNLIPEYFNQFNQTTETGYIESGLPHFDEENGGFLLGEFVVIAGRPAMGKTKLMTKLALNFSLNLPVIYFTYSTSENTLINHFVSSLLGVNFNTPRLAELDNTQKNQIAFIEEEFKKRQLFINDNFNDSIPSLRRHCKQIIKEKGVKVIFIDMLDDMFSGKYHENRIIEMNNICAELKNIARDFNVCVIASTMVDRTVEEREGSKRPLLSDLKYSLGVSLSADKVISLYRDEYYGILNGESGDNTIGLMELRVQQNNNGDLGTFHFRFKN